MKPKSEIERALSENGYRLTRSRAAIIRVLLESAGSLSTQEVCQLARRVQPSVGQVTAYRTLELLSGMGFVRRIHAEDGCHRYACIGRGHRHHLICSECGKVGEFEGCDLRDLMESVRRKTGYVIQGHMLELSGLCPACQASRDDH